MKITNFILKFIKKIIYCKKKKKEILSLENSFLIIRKKSLNSL